jgi:hypothetical protein
MANAAPAPSDAWSGIESGATAIGKLLAAVLDPTSKGLAVQLIQSVFANTVDPKLDAATKDMAGRLVGGLIGGLATPGIESTEHVLEGELEQDLTAPLTAAPVTQGT